MSTSKSKQQRPVWTVNQFRVTLFPKDIIVDYSIKDKWSIPKGFNLEKELKNHQTGELLLEAQDSETVIKLSISPLKINLSFEPKNNLRINMDQDKASISHLGKFDEYKDSILKIADTFIDELDTQYSRLAFGAILLNSAISKQQGYKIIEDYTPLKDLPQNMSDLLVQFNIPKKSSLIEGLLINRLTKWSLLKFRLHPPDQIEQDDVGERLQGLFNRLEIDINTDQTVKDLPGDKSKHIFGELVDMGLEISKKGFK